MWGTGDMVSTLRDVLVRTPTTVGRFVEDGGWREPDRTALLEELPSTAVTQLLKLLTPTERTIAQSLLGYPENSVGRLMTPDFIAVHDDEVAASAMGVNPVRYKVTAFVTGAFFGFPDRLPRVLPTRVDIDRVLTLDNHIACHLSYPPPGDSAVHRRPHSDFCDHGFTSFILNTGYP